MNSIIKIKIFLTNIQLIQLKDLEIFIQKNIALKYENFFYENLK